jgi:hypothetical protein
VQKPAFYKKTGRMALGLFSMTELAVGWMQLRQNFCLPIARLRTLLTHLPSGQKALIYKLKTLTFMK